MTTRLTKEDVLRARAMGIAPDAGDDKDAEISTLQGELTAVKRSRSEWKEAFELMRASREKWRRRWWIAMGVLMSAVVLAALYGLVCLWIASV